MTYYSTPVSASYSIGNTFDLANNRLRADYSINGGAVQAVTNAFDGLDRLVAVQHLNSSLGAGYAYDDNGKLGTMTFRMNGSGIATRSLAYDAEQRLATLNVAHSKDNDLALGYVYNSAQQITQINERASSSCLTTNRFSYDDRDQLTAETRLSSIQDPASSIQYAYDHAQNRLSRKARGVSGSTDDYAYAMANILTNITVGSPLANNRYSYDVAGNLATSVVNGAVAVFRYNAQNKLVRIESEGFTNDFVYDSANRRIAVRKNTDDYRLDIHDGNVCVASVVNGTIRQFFVRGAGIAEGTGDIIAEVEIYRTVGHDAETYYYPHFYVANHRGDTVLTLDSSGTPECYLQYDAFGNPVSSIQYQGSFQPRYTFSTKEYLSDAKLYLYAYRVYDPVAGRWTQRDPIDYQDSVNLYQFCGNNPVNAGDVDGRISWKNVVALSVAAGSIALATAIVLTPGLNVVGCVAATMLVMNAGATIGAVTANMQHEAATGNEGPYNTSGAAGMLTSMVTHDPIANAIASSVDLGTGLASGGLATAELAAAKTYEAVGNAGRVMLAYSIARTTKECGGAGSSVWAGASAAGDVGYKTLEAVDRWNTVVDIGKNVKKAVEQRKQKE